MTTLTAAQMDWDVLTLPGVMTVAERAAAKVARDYRDFVEYDDLFQEAMIRLASDGPKVRSAVFNQGEVGMGAIYHALWRDLLDYIETEVRRKRKSTSYELAVEDKE